MKFEEIWVCAIESLVNHSTPLQNADRKWSTATLPGPLANFFKEKFTFKTENGPNDQGQWLEFLIKMSFSFQLLPYFQNADRQTYGRIDYYPGTHSLDLRFSLFNVKPKGWSVVEEMVIAGLTAADFLCWYCFYMYQKRSCMCRRTANVKANVPGSFWLTESRKKWKKTKKVTLTPRKKPQ